MCQVFGCTQEARYRCSAGFTYCEWHARKAHGSPGDSIRGIPSQYHRWHRLPNAPKEHNEPKTLSEFLRGD